MASARDRAALQNELRTLERIFPGKRVERSEQLPGDYTALATRAHLYCFVVFTSETTAATLAITHERLTEPGLTEVLRELELPELFEREPRGRFVLTSGGCGGWRGGRRRKWWRSPRPRMTDVTRSRSAAARSEEGCG